MTWGSWSHWHCQDLATASPELRHPAYTHVSQKHIFCSHQCRWHKSSASQQTPAPASQRKQFVASRATRCAKQVTSEPSMGPFASECNSTQWLSSANPSRSFWLSQSLICSTAEISACILAMNHDTAANSTGQKPGGRRAVHKGWRSVFSSQIAWPLLPAKWSETLSTFPRIIWTI